MSHNLFISLLIERNAMDEKYLIAVLVTAAVAIYCGKIIFVIYDFNFKLIINKSQIEIYSMHSTTAVVFFVKRDSSWQLTKYIFLSIKLLPIMML